MTAQQAREKAKNTISEELYFTLLNISNNTTKGYTTTEKLLSAKSVKELQEMGYKVEMKKTQQGFWDRLFGFENYHHVISW